MKRFIEGEDRSQITLFPDRLEDYVAEDNPVRVVDAFVDQLDLFGLGFRRVDPRVTGRPGYHPSVLLKLHIYGYLNRVLSSRRRQQRSGARGNGPHDPVGRPVSVPGSGIKSIPVLGQPHVRTVTPEDGLNIGLLGVWSKPSLNGGNDGRYVTDHPELTAKSITLVCPPSAPRISQYREIP